MELILAIALLVLLDVAALRWGADSRDASQPLDRDLALRAPVVRHGVLR